MFVSEATGNAEIYIVTPDGKDTKQLTSNRVIDAAPRWNSNGSSILFLSEGNGSLDIYSMNKDGEQQKRMTSISDVILEADW
jgi:TolB protein